MKYIVLNKVKCLKCNKIIVSRYRHDYQECGCDNNTTVDGGNDYVHLGGKNISLVEQQTVYNTDDFEIVRKSFCRGSRGIDGKKPLKWIPLCEMSTDHINSIFKYNKEHSINMPKWMSMLYNQELMTRVTIVNLNS